MKHMAGPQVIDLSALMGYQTAKGRSARETNIAAARQVAETIRTTLGPKGMDKMLVKSSGDVIVSSDGATILKEMDIEHPSAKIIVEVAKTMDEEIGDGTTTAVVLTGELLKKAEELIEQGVHPSLIVRGYRMAAVKACERLKALGQPLTHDDKDTLMKVALTSMSGKSTAALQKRLAEIAVEAIQQTMEDKDNPGETKTLAVVGESVTSSFLVRGIVLDKEKANPGMPRQLRSAKVALVAGAIEAKKLDDAEIEIRSPAQLQGMLAAEEKSVRDKVEKILSAGANAVFCQKGIGELAASILAKKGVIALANVPEGDMKRLAEATGAQVVSGVSELSKTELGSAGLVEERHLGERRHIFVQDCAHPRCVTAVIRGGTRHVVDEAENVFNDAIGALGAALTSGKVLGGAGAPEMEAALALRELARSLSGREQLAVNAFADGLESIPLVLAENAGLSPVDVLTELRAAHSKGQHWAGVNSSEVGALDSWKAGILEPLSLKTQAVTSAAETAGMILRIDDIVAKSRPGG